MVREVIVLEAKEKWERFRRSGQEKIRLGIALEEYLERENLPESLRLEYERYLRGRDRSAVEALISLGNIRGLERLRAVGILRGDHLDFYLDTAQKSGQTEAAVWLLGEKHGQAEECLKKSFTVSGRRTPGREMECSEEKILRMIRSRLQMKMPEFAAAFGYYCYRSSRKINGIGTDGTAIFYQPGSLLSQLREGDDSLMRGYLHLVLHGLYLHIPAGEKKRGEVWEMACDWEVEYLSDTVYGFLFQRGPDCERKDWYRQLEEISRPVQTEALYRWLLSHPQCVPKIRELFHRDDHSMWKVERSPQEGCGENGVRGRGARIARMAEDAACWNRIRSQIALHTEEQRQRAGAKGGASSEQMELRRQKVYDYRRFLKRYAVSQEELQTDLDSFDYLPYIYSREHYENLVLLEPLETSEVHRLEELVIAVDTSGSCSGKIVQQFMEETYQILSNRENFFRHMHVVVIQCDSMIQGYTVIHSREEWEEYVKNLKVQGFGGTDFRPVFRLVEQMRTKGELRHLKGLLYFTDGDGIYPDQAPDYETDYDILNRQCEKREVPSWAVRLNLNLKI